ncbi:MAG TPA: SMC-Scp complex subunit ScpB [Candidatus Paceibacterota bacterium]|nr:SMC-Scp complex subunit ScpB [Candidatus Paceibacterota bacterium]
MDNIEQKRASLEALLFIHGEPLTFKRIGTVLGINPDELGPFIEEYKKSLETSGRGLQLIADREKAQLTTKPEFNGILEQFVKEEITEDLTPASLEALSIIAYLGPISRAKLEYLRGVNSIVILRSLMIRGLVERAADPEHPGGFVYMTTFDLMKHLGIKDKRDLPDFAKFQELLTVFEEQNKDSGGADQAAVPLPVPPPQA